MCLSSAWCFVILFFFFCKREGGQQYLGRGGGWESFVKERELGEEKGPRRKAARLCQKLDTICEDSGSCWKMSVSVGIALAPQHGRSFAMLYEKADKALYQTKDKGKNGYTVYEEKE